MSETSIRDRLAVQDVMIQYASGVDECDWDRYFAVFAPDVVVTGFVAETLYGVEAVRDFVLPAIAQFRATQHLIAPPWVTIDGDTAHARTDVQASHFYKEPEGRSFTLWGTYKSDFARTATGWHIVRHNLLIKATRIVEPD